MTDLKPCPFCGTQMNFSKEHGLFGWHKSDCFFQFLPEKEVDVTEDEINAEYIEAWNRSVNNDRP